VRIARKLQDVHQGLNLLEEQGKAEGFFNNVENADKLRGLVEDIRDAILVYQVCVCDPHIFDTFKANPILFCPCRLIDG
jgi:hypothetical protein